MGKLILKRKQKNNDTFIKGQKIKFLALILSNDQVFQVILKMKQTWNQSYFSGKTRLAQEAFNKKDEGHTVFSENVSVTFIDKARFVDTLQYC